MVYRLLYAIDDRGNFGDDINQWLWHHLLPDKFVDNSENWVSVIGTIIDEKKMPNADRKIIFSSGYGMGSPPQNLEDKSWYILCVRGPLTAEILNLPAEKAVTDGAILLASLPEYAQPVPVEERHGVYFMPHHDAFTWGGWQDVAKQAGIEFLDPRCDARETIEKIRHAKLVICDAMHAAIVSDTLRTPWIAVRATVNVNVFKWTDWCQSMGMQYQPVSIPPCNVNEYLIRMVREWFPVPHDKIGKKEDVIKASRAYIRHIRKENKFEKQWFFSKFRTALSDVLIKFTSLLNKLGVFKFLNQRLAKKSAKVLKDMCDVSQATLSKDDIHHQKLSLMQEKLKELDRRIQDK